MVIIDNLALMAQFKNLVNDALIHFFVLLVLGDIVTGLAKGVFLKKTDSTKGLLGGIKHLMVVVLVITAVPYLKLLGFEAVASAFELSFIAFYAISFVENWGQLGLPLPDFVKAYFLKLKNQAELKGSKELGLEKEEEE